MRFTSTLLALSLSVSSTLAMSAADMAMAMAMSMTMSLSNGSMLAAPVDMGINMMPASGDSMAASCRQMTGLSALAELANNKTAMAALTAAKQLSPSQASMIEMKAANASEQLHAMQSNSTLMAGCAVWDAQQQLIASCKKMKALTKLEKLVQNSTAMDMIAAKQGLSAAQMQMLQDKASNSSMVLDSMMSNATLVSSCAQLMASGMMSPAAMLSATGMMMNSTGAVMNVTNGMMPSSSAAMMPTSTSAMMMPSASASSGMMAGGMMVNGSSSQTAGSGAASATGAMATATGTASVSMGAGAALDLAAVQRSVLTSTFLLASFMYIFI